MAKHTNYNKPKKIDKIEETIVNVEEALPVDVETPEVLVGFVSGCNKLNVRSNPWIDAKVLTVINENDEVSVIRHETEPEDFYQVRTKNDVEGYCMKKYITLS